MVGAFLVIYGHCYVLKGMPERHFLSWLPLGPLGVYIFFTISGYLVVDSWRRDPSLWRFAARRSLRIFPGLAVCVLLSAFVLGPILTPLPLRTYFTHSQVTDYLANIVLDIHYSLPLVFATNPYPHVVNGSLWSLAGRVPDVRHRGPGRCAPRQPVGLPRSGGGVGRALPVLGPQRDRR